MNSSAFTEFRQPAGKGKGGGHDTDHGEPFTIELQGPADRSRIAAEEAAPEQLAEHDDAVAAPGLVGAGKEPTVQGLMAEHAPHARREPRADETFGPIAARRGGRRARRAGPRRRAAAGRWRAAAREGRRASARSSLRPPSTAGRA
jgi:hypothetical protein